MREIYFEIEFHLFIDLSGDCFVLILYDNDEIIAGFKS